MTATVRLFQRELSAEPIQQDYLFMDTDTIARQDSLQYDDTVETRRKYESGLENTPCTTPIAAQIFIRIFRGIAGFQLCYYHGPSQTRGYTVCIQSYVQSPIALLIPRTARAFLL